MKKLWLLLALIVGVSGPVSAFTPAYRLYIVNRDQNHDYTVRLRNEKSRWSSNDTVPAGGCIVIQRIEPAKYSIRTYRNGTMLSDYAQFVVVDNNFCIRITSVTGKLEGCNRYFCN